jgi:pimeloyl-ACP methyl ester carboxylesterase
VQSIKSVGVSGRRNRVLVDCDDHQPPILLLHGIGRSLKDWSTQFQPLSHAGYRVIAPDLPGSGFSDRLPTSTTGVGLAKGAFGTLDAIGDTRAIHVIGHSMGGAVALNPVSSAGFSFALQRLGATPLIGAVASRHCNRASARMHERRIYIDPSFVTEERIDRAPMRARRPDTAALQHETARSLATLKGVRPE